MKNKRFFVILSILLLAILLSACTSASATNSWGGVSANDSTVFFTNGNDVVALHADSGSLLWTYPEKPAATRLFYASPAIAGDTLIVGDYSGVLAGVGVRDGKELWQFTGAKGRYVDSPLVVNNTIIAPNADSSVYALDMNGKLLWSYKGTHAFWATPVSDGTTVYAPSLDHYLYALNLADGKLVWKVDLGGPIVGSPILSADGTLYQGTLGSTLFSIKAADGSVNWKQTLPGRVWSTPVAVADRLYIGDDSGKINLIKSADGSIIQSIDLQSAILGSGVAVNDNIVFADEKADVIIIGKNGERVATPTVTGKLYSDLVFSNSHIYVLSTKGDHLLYAIDANGLQVWNYSVSK
jgi:outer membrane protein assembly factor BamB